MKNYLNLNTDKVYFVTNYLYLSIDKASPSMTKYLYLNIGKAPLIYDEFSIP